MSIIHKRCPLFGTFVGWLFVVITKNICYYEKRIETGGAKWKVIPKSA
jgi:hypothetical protein